MMRVMRVGVLLALAGCDAVLGLDPIAAPPAGGPTAIAAGHGHTCWIRSGDHSLFCWGQNDYGQLGVPGVQFDAPQQVSGTWTQVSTAHNTTCAIQKDRSLWCWGDNSSGQAGNATSSQSRAPEQISGTWKRVSAGAAHTCAIDDQGALWCWGDNTYGQLGDGTMMPSSAPLHVGDGYTAVATGGFHTCAIRTDQTLACWGLGLDGQLGAGMPASSLQPVGPGGSWLDVVAGAFHTCARTRAGQLRCWGANFTGQVGIADMLASTPATVLVDGVDRSDWIGVAANGVASCAWTTKSAWCFGDSSHGELGLDGNPNNPTPTAFAGGPVSAIALGENHACAIDTKGGVSCAGANGYGQLGTLDTSQLAPQLVSSASWNRVTAGPAATCAIDTSNHASCGGNNFSGGLGVGDRISRRTLVPLDPSSTWNDIALGPEFALALDVSNGNTGKPYGWGDNSNGVAGLPMGTPYAPSPTPIMLQTLSKDAVQIRGSTHGCAIDDSQQLSCWGANDFGQLALPPSSTPQYTPGPAIVTTTETQWNRIGVGDAYTCAIGRGTQYVFCWGYNRYGQLGDGGTTDHYMPTQIASTRQFAGLAIGYLHACGHDNAGDVLCWGYNALGEVGTGGMSMSAPPTVVASASGWKQVTTGLYHTCAIRGDGRLACWGDNRHGQLGNNDPTRASQMSPTLIGTDTDWIWVSASFESTCGIRGTGDLYCWGSNNDGQLLDDRGWRTEMMPVDMPP